MRKYHGYFEKGHKINNGRKHSAEMSIRRLATLKIVDPEGLRYEKANKTKAENLASGATISKPGWNKGNKLTSEWAGRIGDGNKVRHLSYKMRAEIYKMYVDNEMTIQAIAEKIGIGRHSVTRRLKEAGVKIKGAGDFIRGRHLTEEHIRKCLRRRIPTSLEKRFLKIVEKNGLPYKYVGDGSFVIAGKNPDFININGDKIAIEVFAEFYKKMNGRNIDVWRDERKQLFKEYGWDLLFFSQKEVTESYVLKQLT